MLPVREEIPFCPPYYLFSLLTSLLTRSYYGQMNILRSPWLQNLRTPPMFVCLWCAKIKGYSSVTLKSEPHRVEAPSKNGQKKQNKTQLQCVGDTMMQTPDKHRGTNLRLVDYRCLLEGKAVTMNSTPQGEGKPTALFCVYWIRSISFPVAPWQIVPSETATSLRAQEKEKEIIKMIIAYVSVLFCYQLIHAFSFIIDVWHVRGQ